MQESNSELSEKSGMLQAEKKLLEEDIKRWKARTQVRSFHVSSSDFWRNYFFTKIDCTLLWCLAPGEPAKRHWPRGVQASALWAGSTSQTHPATRWRNWPTQSWCCQVRTALFTGYTKVSVLFFLVLINYLFSTGTVALWLCCSLRSRTWCRRFRR